jgi:hypothetical protein
VDDHPDIVSLVSSELMPDANAGEFGFSNHGHREILPAVLNYAELNDPGALMTTDIPPPPQPPATNWLRIGGIIAALSAPISGFVLYALGSVLIGEDRLEDQNGLTGIGWMMFVIPVVVGLGLLAMSLTGRTGPSRRVAGLTAAALAVGCLLAGVVAMGNADPGDASIGGGLLMLAGLGLAVAAGLLLRARGYRPQSR